MPTPETLARFIARVESGAHVEAIEEFYTPCLLYTSDAADE